MTDLPRHDDPERAAEEAKAHRARVDQASEDVKVVLSTPQGRRFVWAIIERSGVEAAILGSDALMQNQRIGARAVGIGVLQQCRLASLGLTKQMHAEALDSIYKGAK